MGMKDGGLGEPDGNMGIALPTPKTVTAVCSKVQLRNQGRHTLQSKTMPAASKTLAPAAADTWLCAPKMKCAEKECSKTYLER